jgi:glycosyltransferase involved in cell wall biosynthesis
MSANPAVSIVTATRNRPHVLASALQGILAQTFNDYELLVVDDGSPADVLQAYAPLLAPFGDRAHVLLKDSLKDKSGTPAIARNRGIRSARGKWIAFVDDDDRWVDPDHLAIAVSSLETTNADFFFANMYCERAGKVEIPDSYPGSTKLTSGRPIDRRADVYAVSLSALTATLRHHCIHPNVMVVRRDLLQSLGGFCERIVFCEDYELGMRLIDTANLVLFRSYNVAAYALPEGHSHSLRVTPTDQILDRITATINIRAKCKTAAVRRCARQRESWALRELAILLNNARLHSEAIRMAYQGAAVRPSAGSLVFLLQTLMTSCVRMLADRKCRPDLGISS